MRKEGHHYVDIWKPVLDGSGRVGRLTHFNRHPGFKSSNPVVSDGGQYMAFQIAEVGDQVRVGRGIFIYNIFYLRLRRRPEPRRFSADSANFSG
jgi:hypothetical protein